MSNPKDSIPVGCKSMPATEDRAEGWGCCACEAKNGMGTWNGATRDTCKHCGHERCDRRTLH